VKISALLGWKSREPSVELSQSREENIELRRELAQSVVRFEYRRSKVAEVADDAMAFMNEGRQR